MYSRDYVKGNQMDAKWRGEVTCMRRGEGMSMHDQAIRP